VEFAQAALALQDLSGGRYEAALGAGWARDEVEGMGLPFPDDRTRARRFKEALQVIRDLLREGACQFDGEHYRISIRGLSPLSESPPPLVAAVAGPWTASNVPPLVDRVEIALPGSAHPMIGGAWDASRLGQLRWDDIARMCDRIRAANPSVLISCGLVYGVGAPAAVAPLRTAFGDGLISSLIGDPADVAARLVEFTELGIDRITLMPFVEGSHAAIAPHLKID
jgi:alkanesulfonate monooxygenase SsuD/methylene tetrahydromethanopterin reductase-like flavin-dependent oxidoreductase (luciferase family)